MSRRGKSRQIPDDDEDFDYEVNDNEVLPARRSRSRVTSYKEQEEDYQEELQEDTKEEEAPQDIKAEPEEEAEEDIFADDSSTEKDDGGDDYIEDDNVDNEDDDQITTSRRKRGRKKIVKNRHIGSDDEFYDDGDDDDDDDIISEEDDYMEKLQQRNFIVQDEEDEDGAYGVSRPKKKKAKKVKKSRSASPKRSTRSGKTFGEDILPEPAADDESEDDIQKEIADLYDSSPIKGSPVQHKLRERAKVDYTIPPPISNDTMFNSFPRANTPKRGRGRPSYNKSEFRKILYPTAGPFGGSDVISLFGTNIPPGGIPIQTIPGMPQASSNNLTAIGQNLSDSDSSEDEIAPINGEATVSKKAPKPKSGTKLTTGGDTRKKSNLSDTDPLGVDMNIDFSVVGGLDNYINQLKEMVALPLLYPELYQNFGITPPRGVLFHGPPGTGKTLMARALAASCSTAERKITFFMRKGADCLSKWVGEAERQLRLLFEEAKNQQPSIIFFDEIDGLAPVRSSKQEQIHASIVSTLLALMDGMDNRGQVIVIGATNRPDSIDPALRRPGRFDREFYFPLPDIPARLEILQIHTRKWQPPLPKVFLEKLAELTKGYGGADLRALCTEAALNSIQRKYPQIYSSNDKLKINPSKVTVIAQDFMKAMEKIVPSSARSTSSGSAPLPEHLVPLLEDNFKDITSKLNELLPGIKNTNSKKTTTLEEAKYLDPSIKDEDGGFSKHQLLRSLDTSRIFKPHLLISGPRGNGQQYLGAAILNHLEGFQIQSLDLGNMFGDVTRTPESTIVQTFVEARRHQPSIIYIPNIEIWFNVVPYTARATLISLFRGLKSNERVLLLGISDCHVEELDDEIKDGFGFGKNDKSSVELKSPTQSQRENYFSIVLKTIHMRPFEFINDLENRPLRKLKQLKIVKEQGKPSDVATQKEKAKEQEYKDTKLKNILKIKLAGLMDLFKNRYKRFKKPIIDENFLIHLFDPSVLENPLNLYEVLYVKSDDPEHKNMIKELTTGRYYYNMDLDTIEERLWNGYYSEPKQFLKDIKMIVRDSITSGDRERILKANEMLTNAQFGIDDFSTPEFLKNCREVRERDLKKQEKLLEEHRKLQEELQKQAELSQTLTHEAIEGAIPEEPHVNGVVVNSDPAPVSSLNNLLTETSAEAPAPEVRTANEIVPIVTDQVEEQVEDQVEEQVEEREQVQDQEPVKEQEEPESDSESEAEELDIDQSRQVTIDEDKLQSLNNKLVTVTDNYNIEKLENVMAKLMDIVWKDRNQWDKSETLQNLTTAIKSL